MGSVSGRCYTVDMYGNPHIHAVGDVTMECPPGREDGLRRFYGEIIGLREIPDGEASGGLAFMAHQRQVVVRFRPNAATSPMRRRLVVVVDSLEETGERLREIGVTWRRHFGMGVGDQRLIIIDPGGNRIELKQVWPL